MALSPTNNLILYYKWGDSTTSIWTLTAHTTLHTFSHITGTGPSGSLPITGFYGGKATSVQTNLGYTFSCPNTVGHISKIEAASDSCLVESTVSSPSTSMDSVNGNGHGVEC